MTEFLTITHGSVTEELTKGTKLEVCLSTALVLITLRQVKLPRNDSKRRNSLQMSRTQLSDMINCLHNFLKSFSQCTFWLRLYHAVGIMHPKVILLSHNHLPSLSFLIVLLRNLFIRCSLDFLFLLLSSLLFLPRRPWEFFWVLNLERANPSATRQLDTYTKYCIWSRLSNASRFKTDYVNTTLLSVNQL